MTLLCLCCCYRYSSSRFFKTFIPLCTSEVAEQRLAEIQRLLLSRFPLCRISFHPHTTHSRFHADEIQSLLLSNCTVCWDSIRNNLIICFKFTKSFYNCIRSHIHMLYLRLCLCVTSISVYFSLLHTICHCLCHCHFHSANETITNITI